MAFDREAWLAKRRKYITASDAAAVIGKNPYKKPLEVYLDKMGLLPPFAGNEHTRRGVENEPLIIKSFAETVADVADVKPNSGLVFPKKYPFLAATPDGTLTYKGEHTTLEVKCPSKQWESPPEYYVVQVWVQVLACDAAGGFLAWKAVPVEPPISNVYYSRDVLCGKYDKYLERLKFFFDCVQAQDLHPEFW